MKDLMIESEAPVDLHGSEAVNLFAKQLNFKAQDISIASVSKVTNKIIQSNFWSKTFTLTDNCDL